MPDKKAKKPVPTGVIFRAFWRVTKEHLWLLACVLGSVIIVQLADLAAPLYLRTFFNTLSMHTPSAAIAASLTTTLLFVVLMWFIDWAGTRAQGLASEHLESESMEKLYGESFEYLLGHSHNFFVSNFGGALTGKVNKYTQSFERAFDAVLTQFLPTALFVVGAVIVLALHNLMLGLLLAGWSIAMVLFQMFLSRFNRTIRHTRTAANTDVTARIADTIANQNTISLFSALPFELENFKELVHTWREATLKSWVADNWTWGSLGLFMVAIQGTLLWAAVHYWSLGLLTVGDFVLIQAYLLTTFQRLMGINWQLRSFYDALADAGEMIEILQTPHEIKDSQGAQSLQVSRGEIWFDDVSFDFHKGTPVLKQFNLTIAGGEKIALVGPSGAGKSTVTKLLLRLYDVEKGEIKIDGQNIAAVTQDSLREAIAFVPQEPILFHRSLMENIRYGRRDASDEEVIEAAKKAHCHEFIDKLPQKYDTLVGERGIKLSGGERQRVAIARAILKNAPILVLDEATSSLDSESEQYIQDALELLMRGKTVLVIAHRLSTIMKMDRIVVMEQGSIVATGTHLELVNQRGLYQKLWSIQAGGFLGGTQKSEEEMDESERELAAIGGEE